MKIGFAEEINVKTVPTLVLLRDNNKYIYNGEYYYLYTLMK